MLDEREDHEKAARSADEALEEDVDEEGGGGSEIRDDA